MARIVEQAQVDFNKARIMSVYGCNLRGSMISFISLCGNLYEKSISNNARLTFEKSLPPFSELRDHAFAMMMRARHGGAEKKAATKLIVIRIL